LFEKRIEPFLETTAVVPKNGRSRFAKPLQSFPQAKGIAFSAKPKKRPDENEKTAVQNGKTVGPNRKAAH